MKIYIAGSYIDQIDLRGWASVLWDLGHEVTGSWLQEVTKPASMAAEVFEKKLAIKDIAEVYQADLLIMDNRQSTGGKNVELGVALGQFQHKEVWLVGEPTNVFHRLADQQFDNWSDCIDHMIFITKSENEAEHDQ